MNGQELREYRRALGLTQAKLGERIGLTRIMIGFMERGLREITPRTQAALRAAQPRPLARLPSKFSPLIVKLERALIAAGLNYKADFRREEAVVDFYLHDLDIGLNVDSSRGERRRDFPASLDMITIEGKAALDAFVTLIEHGGIHARLNAGRDPYAHLEEEP